MTISYRNIAHLTIWIVLVLALSFLRISLALLYPLMALMLAIALNLKFELRTLGFAAFFVFCGVLSSYWAGGYYTNLMVSLCLLLPALLFLRAPIVPRQSGQGSYYEYVLKRITWVLVVINISAFIYAKFIVNTSISNYEDSFTGLYGQSGFGSHTLSVVNLGVSVLFLNRKSYLKFAFFFLCGLMGFYGLGLMIFIATLGVLYAAQLVRYWKVFLVLIASALVGVFFISIINAKNLDYIKKNIDQALLVFESYDYQEELQKSKSMRVTQIPRFITFLDGARQRLLGDSKVFFLGTAPGGYNSRTAFYLNGDFVQNQFLLDHFQIQTPEHEEDVFPLLNRNLISRPYNDGTRNQTFSSVVALLLEYGILAGGGYLLLFFSRIRSISKLQTDFRRKNDIKFLGIYFFFLFCVQNYLEYPEVLFLFLMIIKLAEADSIQDRKLQAQ